MQKTIRTFSHSQIRSDFPKKLDPETLYIDKMYKTIAYLCPCGCGKRVEQDVSYGNKEDRKLLITDGPRFTIEPPATCGDLTYQIKDNIAITIDNAEDLL